MVFFSDLWGHYLKPACSEERVGERSMSTLNNILIDLLDFLNQSSLRCEFRKNIMIQTIKTAVQIFASSNTLSKFKEARDGPAG